MGILLEKNCELCFNDCCMACIKEHQHSVFSVLSKSDLELLLKNKKEITFQPGETIFRQNTTNTHVICIKNGLSKVYIEGMNGKKLIFKIIKDLDFITGGGIFAENSRHFTVSALTEVKCCFINSDQIIKLFSVNRDFAIELMKHHSSQTSYILNYLINLTQKYMHGRVADSLLYLKNEVFKKNPFQILLSRQELADMSDMTKESYIRILKDFNSNGIIAHNRNTIKILDENALIAISKKG